MSIRRLAGSNTKKTFDIQCLIKISKSSSNVFVDMERYTESQFYLLTFLIKQRYKEAMVEARTLRLRISMETQRREAAETLCSETELGNQ